ncbi:PREDICTED: thioredoxin domain-containing protein 9-like [Theobroma cacao]|uniref:Thioredoxin domain-containing protein 9-like n=1 Tax=Theobroma cacao TaxID=3641 RepID=A0AB32VZ72_THECC|nr:PREDICTED: thioredoxin domain-containing protein 9-like [Theobroma cacao]
MCRVDQGRFTDEVTTGYDTWHDQRVKNVVCPPRNPSKHPINPEPQDVLLESELTRKRLEKEMMNMKRRHEDELEEVKKKTTRKVRMALEERDEWRSKFEKVNVANSSLIARMQELQSVNNALQHEMREVAFRARVMADKTEELRREVLLRDELRERLIDHLRMVRDQYDKVGFSFW